MARRNRIKKHLTTKIYNVDNSLEKLVMSEIKKANRKLDSLYRHYKKGSWSTKKLMDRLGSETLKAWDFKRGKIKVPKHLNKTKLTAINKAISQFNASATSTHKGIKSISNRTKLGIKKALDIFDMKDITDKEVEDMYNMLKNRDFTNLADKIGASTLWALIEDSVEASDSEEDFKERLSMYIESSNDLDMKETAQRLYDKYIA